MTYRGMPGFGEHGRRLRGDGVPGGDDGDDGWDLEIAVVTGLRWWYLHLTFHALPDYAFLLAPLDRASLDMALFRPSYPEAGIPARMIAGDFPALRGMYRQLWTLAGGWMQASCRDATHEPVTVPQSCGCGLWAYWSAPHPEEHALATLARETAYTLEVAIPVLGAIEGAGRTVTGTRGFRCSRARVTALAPVPLPPPDGCHPRLADLGPVPSWLAGRAMVAEALAERLELTPGAVRELVRSQLSRAIPGIAVHPRARELIEAVVPDPAGRQAAMQDCQDDCLSVLAGAGRRFPWAALRPWSLPWPAGRLSDAWVDCA